MTTPNTTAERLGKVTHLYYGSHNPSAEGQMCIMEVQ